MAIENRPPPFTFGLDAWLRGDETLGQFVSHALTGAKDHVVSAIRSTVGNAIDAGHLASWAGNTLLYEMSTQGTRSPPPLPILHQPMMRSIETLPANATVGQKLTPVLKQLGQVAQAGLAVEGARGVARGVVNAARSAATVAQGFTPPGTPALAMELTPAEARTAATAARATADPEGMQLNFASKAKGGTGAASATRRTSPFEPFEREPTVAALDDAQQAATKGNMDATRRFWRDNYNEGFDKFNETYAGLKEALVEGNLGEAQRLWQKLEPFERQFSISRARVDQGLLRRSSDVSPSIQARRAMKIDALEAQITHTKNRQLSALIAEAESSALGESRLSTEGFQVQGAYRPHIHDGLPSSQLQGEIADLRIEVEHVRAGMKDYSLEIPTNIRGWKRDLVQRIQTRATALETQIADAKAASQPTRVLEKWRLHVQMQLAELKGR